MLEPQPEPEPERRSRADEAVKVCVLDDYQAWRAVATGPLGDSVDVTFYSDNEDDWTTEWSAALVERCAPFDVVVTMRERSRFPRAVLEQPPKLKLLCTQGGRNASIDVAAASERGIPCAVRPASPSTAGSPGRCCSRWPRRCRRRTRRCAPAAS